MFLISYSLLKDFANGLLFVIRFAKEKIDFFFKKSHRTQNNRYQKNLKQLFILYRLVLQYLKKKKFLIYCAKYY